MMVVAFLLTVGLSVASAQNVGSLQGIVTDPAGAAVSGANVKLTDAASAAVRTVTSDGTGAYGFAQLNPGL